MTAKQDNESPEQVLCYPRYLVDKLLPAQFNEDYPLYLINSGQHCWVDKEQAEQDQRYKQVCSYCVVTFQGNYLVYTRPSKGEAKLSGLLSIGVGGHISDGPDWPHRAIDAGVQRELREELGEREGVVFNPVFKGCINDNTTPVGQLHVGLVYLVDLGWLPDMEAMSKELAGPTFVSFNQLAAGGVSSFEAWSQIVLKTVVNLPTGA